MPHPDGVNALFVGHGKSAICWYRCTLPAQVMGADWVAVAEYGTPGELDKHRLERADDKLKLVFLAGLVSDDLQWPTFEDYNVVVLQTPRGIYWHDRIKALQKLGVKVLIDVDDHVQSIGKMPDHEMRRFFRREHVREIERNMRIADGLLVPTQWLADRYRKRFNDRVWVCRNGIDLGRYNVTRPARSTVNIIWAGATAHGRNFQKLILPLVRVLRDRPNVRFCSIGQPFAEPLREHFPGRCTSIPFAALETYPAAMTNGDIALAPAGDSFFFLAKSDLRMLEAGALGIPTIGDPRVYREIVHGVNGLAAQTADEFEAAMFRLVDDAQLRARLGAEARRYVVENRTLRQTSHDWFTAFAEVFA